MRNKKVVWPHRRVRFSIRDLRVTRARLLGSHGRWEHEVECGSLAGLRRLPTFDRWHDWLKRGGWHRTQVSDEQLSEMFSAKESK